MGSRGFWHVMSARKRRGLALSWSALFVLSLLLQYFSFALAAPALAVHDEGLFELDGNAVNQAAAGDDWDVVRAGTSSAFQEKFVTDAVNSTPDEHLFQGGGSKDEQPISAWKWTAGAGVQDKNDIEHAFAAAYTAVGGARDGHTIVYFGQDRYAQDGDAFVGFWFFKGGVSEHAGGTFNGAHQDGDILVQVNFTNGGVIQDFKISKWLSGALHQVDTGVECTAALANDDACGKVNGVGIGEISSPWSYTPKSGTANKIPEGGFFEAGIDLTNEGLDSGCFSTFLAETRSSQSLTSTLSDYALGSFSFCVDAQISTQVKQGGTSTGSNGHITIGESVTDTATLTGSKGTVAGSVDFFLCGPSSSAPDCTSGGTKVDTKTLASGAATSDAVTPTAVGSYCFRVEYTPATGSKYNAGSHTNTTTECFVVDKKQPSISTSEEQSVNVGASVSDTATLTGATADAGGTITFRAYGPADDNCDGTPAFVSDPVAVSGDGDYGPVSFVPDTAGTYHWIASYSGDAKNAAKAGACGDAGEDDTVNKLTPSISTDASADVVIGGAISDTATVSGGHTPTGTVTFRLYGPNDASCATAIFTSANRPLTGGSATSAEFTPPAVGTYRWIATYNGDANNNSVAGKCDDANESVVVSKTTPSINTNLVSGAESGATISVALGATVHDTSSLSGTTADAGGTVHYQVFTNANCTGTAIDAGTKAVTSGIPADSDPVTFNNAGNYYWQADYSGDAKNGSASSNCSLEIVSVGLNQPTISTNASDSVLVGGKIHDTATLAAGFNPTGTITFRLYGPNDSTCTNGAIFTDAATVSGNGDYTSADFTTTQPGTYFWVATYGGDSNNAAAAGACGDANENVVVTTPNLHAVKLVKTNDGSFGPTSTAQPGDVLTYQVTITNSGNGDALNVPVSDDISAILAHASYNDDCSNGCSFAANTLSWTIPSIAANGGSVVLTFSVTLDDTFPTGTTHLPNVVVVTGPGSNCAAGSGDADCGTDTTVAAAPDLDVEKLVAVNDGEANHGGLAKPGDTLNYQITITNSGTAAATNVPVSDDISAVLAHATYNADCSNGCTLDGSTLKWTIGSIAANGGSVTLTFSVTLDHTFPTGTTLLPNVIVVTGPGSNCEAGSQDASCGTENGVGTSMLVISKAFTGNTGGTDPDLHVPSATIGDTLHYTLTYHGEGDLTNAVITDVLPVGLAYVDGSAQGDSHFTFDGFNATTRTLTWKAAVLLDPAAAGSNLVDGSVTYDVQVLAAAPEQPQPLVNTATIDSDQTGPDSDTASVAVLAPPEALTPPPTDTLSPATAAGNPGQALMLILLAVGALALSLGILTPVPERARRRDRNR
jgi:uncharacterized repeat protein (TIGR01451 family)